MDPNEALKGALAALQVIRTLADEEPEDGDVSDISEAAQELADAFEALDGWLSKGGFLPAAWQR